MIYPVTPLLVDYIAVTADGRPECHGFEPIDDWQFKSQDGWRARTKTHKKTGRTFTYGELSGFECARRLRPMARWNECSYTRVDVTRDVVGLEVHPALVHMFAGVRSDPSEQPMHGWRTSSKGSTLYVGSPESPVMLRLYTKNDACAGLQGLWAAHGWTGQPVTRVEYQCRTKQVRRAMRMWQGVESDWEPAIAALWADCLARIRLCTSAPRTHRQQNEAATRKDWAALAEGGPRKLAAPPHPQPVPSLQHVERLLSSYLERGGDPARLQAVLASLVRVRK